MTHYMRCARCLRYEEAHWYSGSYSAPEGWAVRNVPREWSGIGSEILLCATCAREVDTAMRSSLGDAMIVRKVRA